MHYFNWILKYRQQALSSADRQAYEHEQTENSQLRSETEAVDLMESLLSAGSAGLSESEILGDQPSGKKYTWTFLAASGALVILLLISGWFYYRNQQQVDQPANQVPVKEWGPRFFDQLDEMENGEGPVALDVRTGKEFHKFTTETSAHQIEAKRKYKKPVDNILVPMVDEEPSEPLAEVAKKEVGENIELGNTEVDRGAALAITAKKTITLKPGFHAKAGASFRAIIED